MTRELSLESSLLGRAGALAIIASGFATTAVAQSSETSVEFDMPAQSLDQALRNYGVVADKQVMFSVDLVDGKTVGPVTGEMTADEALQTLLADTGLVFETTSSDVILIRTAQWNASVTGRNSLQTVRFQDAAPRRIESVDEKDDDGGFVVSEGEGDVFQQLEEIIVTGTNIRGLENPTVPVLQFDREDIDLSGAATVDDFLRTIPQNFASETQLSSESGNPNDSGRNISQGTTVDLRGLGAGSTLTLLNGRRMTAAGQSNNVDLNVLPLGAIERVDVLTDGATAVYGSDAVGGVINFITRKDYEGFDVSARYGTVTEGSKEDFGIGAAGGFKWASGGVFAGADYQENTPLLVEERGFVDLSQAREGATFGSESERFSVAAGMNQELSSSLRMGVDLLLTDLESQSFSLLNTIPRVATAEQNALFVNSHLEYDITDRITSFFFVDYGENKVDNNFTFPSTGDEANSEFDNVQVVFEGRISGELVDLPAGAMSFSLGALYREEEFKTFRSSELVIAGEREITAAYAELLVPVIGGHNSMPWLQKLDMSFAGRYEDYSDFGDTFDPKVGAYLELDDQLSVRASYSDAFRAPDLSSVNQQQDYRIFTLPASLFTEAAPEDFFTSDPFPSYLVLLPTGGNPELTPERARTWSAGFSFEPAFAQGLSVQGNYFDINYTDRLDSVFLLDPVQDPAFRSLVDIPPVLSEVQALFARGEAGDITLLNGLNASPEDIQVVFAPTFTNIAERDVRGMDMSIDYSFDTAHGRFTAGANATYLFDYISRLTPAAESTEQLNILYRPVDLKVRGNLSWRTGGFTAFAAVNYVDDYRDHPDEAIAESIDSWTTVDVSLAYNAGNRLENVVADGVRIGLSVTNLFDEDPPFAATPFGLNFDTANANPFGRQVSVTLSKAF